MNFIGQYEISKDICDDLIYHFNSSEKKERGKLGEMINESKKKSTDVGVKSNDSIFHTYVDSLQSCLEKYIDEYYYSGTVPPFWVEGFNIQRYKPSEGFYAWHNELGDGDSLRRHLVFMTYLNDVENGGETEFFYQKLKVKPKKGLTLIWPPSWTHTHRGVVSETQDKYITTGWYVIKEHK